MRIVFLLLILCSFAPGDAFAQRSAQPRFSGPDSFTSNPRGADDDTKPVPGAGRDQVDTPRPGSGAGRGDDAQDHAEDAVITGVSNACVHPGDVLALEGRNLAQLVNEGIPAFAEGAAIFPLKVLSRAEERLMVQAPDDEALHAHARYQLVLVDKKRTGQIIGRYDVRVRSCPVRAGQQKIPETKTDTLADDGGAEPGEILILVEHGDARRIENYAREKNYAVLRNHVLSSLGRALLILRVQDGSVNALIRDMRRQFPGASIDRNHHFYPSAQPRLYAPDKINWNQGGACGKALKKVSVGLIDGQVDTGHKAFQGQNIIQKNFIEAGKPDMDHGTGIASLLIGNAPDQGYAGLAPGMRIYSAVALRVIPKGDQLANTEAIALGMDWLLKNKVRLINISLASDKPNRVLESLFKQAAGKGALAFAAAGNEGSRAPPSYPAAFDNVIAVTAVDAAERVYKHASHGAYIDFAAPGVDVWVARGNGGGAYESGTSFAVPFALGIAAQNLARNGSLSYALVMEALKQGAKDLGAAGRDNAYGWGLVQAGSCQ